MLSVSIGAEIASRQRLTPCRIPAFIQAHVEAQDSFFVTGQVAQGSWRRRYTLRKLENLLLHPQSLHGSTWRACLFIKDETLISGTG